MRLSQNRPRKDHEDARRDLAQTNLGYIKMVPNRPNPPSLRRSLPYLMKKNSSISIMITARFATSLGNCYVVLRATSFSM